MRKEVVIAIVAGVIFGLIVALGIWRANSALKDEAASTEAPQEQTNETQTSVSFDLTISDPEENDVVTSLPLTLVGITSPNTWVAISGEDEDYTTLSDQSGEFREDIDLTGGVNQIVVTAFSESGESIEKTVRVVYSTEFTKVEETNDEE